MTAIKSTLLYLRSLEGLKKIGFQWIPIYSWLGILLFSESNLNRFFWCKKSVLLYTIIINAKSYEEPPEKTHIMSCRIFKHGATPYSIETS